ncbi:MAG TPA: glycoside hydrolase family 3 N-terminal domain-containing protein, partial [Flavobacteriaceae bacterium]|nr:glycoside hydrolase family 3 N-terminal domain-containing protein [Flavobacteriaceae bacterium]
ILKKIPVIIAFLCAFMLSAQPKHPLVDYNDIEHQRQWVDSVYYAMDLEERIGQLYMVDVFSQAPKATTDKVKEWIEKYHIGGVIFSKGGPKRQAKLNNEFQELSKIPLLIAMDAEWGLAMRLDSTFAYPWNMTLGAVQDDKLIEQVGKRIADHAKRLGVHINFAPSVDVNNNPNNPIIGNRSFGEIPEQVARKASAFVKGMESNGVLSSLKHFPGHGNTDQDSHLELPTIGGTRAALDSVELYPFQRLLQENIASSVMTAHLHVPALEPSKTTPVSLSKSVVTDLLRSEYGFQGLVFTDALNMRGATNGLKSGEADLKAFLAGNDILLIPQFLPQSRDLLLEACKDGRITEERLAYSVKKILQAKYKVGLQDYTPVAMENLYEDLNTIMDTTLYQRVMEEAITVVKNEENTLPFRELENKNIAYVSFGEDSGAAFLNGLRNYTDITHVKGTSLADYDKKLNSYTDVIVGLHKKNDNPWQSYKFTSAELNLLEALSQKHKIHLVVFSSPYSLLEVATTSLESITVAYQNSPLTQEIAPQILFGAIGSKGKLPVGAGKNIPAGHGISTQSIKRLGYGTPESVGVNSKTLKQIDSVVTYGLKEEMMPGAQILIARGGKIIYQKSYGKHRYISNRSVENQDIYDLASLTKILATLPMVMKLVDEGAINLDTRLDQMLPEYRNTDKGAIILLDLLTHYNRLQPWIPFYRTTLDNETNHPDSKYYQKASIKGFSSPVAENLYIRNDYKDTIHKRILESNLRPRKGYRYSDLPFYLLQKYIESYYGDSLDSLAEKYFYSKLGATTMTYLPLNKFSKERIPPTENDNYFRYQEIQGYVHDQGAAMMGGVAGHAGLFSNAHDIAKMMQMFIWEGDYGGTDFISADTFRQFNTCYYCDQDVRRGIGFDKPQLGDVGPTCGCVSMTSFGHSGFTGTFAWADPEEEIIYVFLSNRTYPDAENGKLIRNNLRSNIQAIIYESIEDSFVH